MLKTQLQTVRLAPKEKALVEAYIQQNPIFESFSSLARVATLSFIGEAGNIQLRPVKGGHRGSRPSFLWDYDLTEVQVRELLARPGMTGEKRWLIGRILAEARFEEVFSYLTVDDIQRALPHLRLRPNVRERWTYAIDRWTRSH
ncbi:MAG: hypothetical protein HYV03_00465 [Deltaproteobacteria bacterium]|nr:hypothetical protein [Deltaproteobacteria bacterium]